ncbi:MAG TPA: GntR family transcriptional regulator [Vicinamibacterales bacterium]|nr:GntR family transcriptional regulator [Vicinamibacterales bacterium]
MPLTVGLDERDRTPVHAQVERGILAAIASGRLEIGEQLPTVRQLAVELRVNANTIAKVYAHLERDGVLETRRGVGTFVAAREPHLRDDARRGAELKRIVERFFADLSTHGFTFEDARPLVGALADAEGRDEPVAHTAKEQKP